MTTHIRPTDVLPHHILDALTYDPAGSHRIQGLLEKLACFGWSARQIQAQTNLWPAHGLHSPVGFAIQKLEKLCKQAVDQAEKQQEAAAAKIQRMEILAARDAQISAQLAAEAHQYDPAPPQWQQLADACRAASTPVEARQLVADFLSKEKVDFSARS